MSEAANNYRGEKEVRLLRMVSLCSVVVAVTIITVKVAAWVQTDSLSLFSSLVDSFLDLVASMINFFALRYALMPADEDHRFGHGKAEDIAALMQSGFIAASGMFVAVEAGRGLFNPAPVTHADFGISVMVFSTVITIALVLFQLYVMKRVKSSLIAADSLHYQTDLLLNVVVIGALYLSQYGDMELVDPILAMCIALYIMRCAWKVGKTSVDNLMDKELSEKERGHIMNLICSHESVKGVHDLRTRSSASKPFIQFHLELDPMMELREAHRISDEVEIILHREFKDAEIIIHQDPEGEEVVPLYMSRVVSVTRPDDEECKD